jgi:hypothetical protein
MLPRWTHPPVKIKNEEEKQKESKTMMMRIMII